MGVVFEVGWAGHMDIVFLSRESLGWTDARSSY